MGLRSVLLASLLLAAPQARAQLFWFAQPENPPPPQQSRAHSASQAPQQRQQRAHAQQQQPQQAPQQREAFWFFTPQDNLPPPHAAQPAPQRQFRARPGEDDNAAVVELSARNAATEPGLPRRDGAVATAVLPPDADPNYSTPINYDPDVNYKFKTQKQVSDPTGQAAGTITINTAQRKLYYSLGGGQAMEYSIGVGKQGFSWKGEATVGRKSYWPGWTPPPEMLERRPELPEHMDGSLANPLGARALYLFQDNKDTLFRIHGTNEPQSIGHAVSSGCIRMHNADVIDLYGRVTKGAHVVVM
jgi:lipoprotein-anchoring transpeptidase ErfK/SrfK